MGLGGNMAEPNYMAYAQYMGARNPIAEGLNQLGSTLGDIQKNQIERENMKRRNNLADLQMQQMQMQMEEAKRQQEYQQGMRNAAQNPASVTSIAPQQMQQPQTLGQLIPSGMPSQQPFTMPQQAASPTVQAYNEGRVSTKTETPGMAMSKYAMSQGNIADAQKTLTVEDALAQFGAKLQESGGDLAQYYQKKQELDTYKTFISEIAPLLKSPEGRKVAQTISQKYQQMYPGHEQAFDISTISVQPDKLVNTLFDEQGNPAGRIISMPDGTTKFDPPEKAKETWSEPYMATVGGKKAMVQKSSNGQIKPVIQDVSTTIKVNAGGGDGGGMSDAMAWAKAVEEGRANLQDIPQRGTMRSQVVKLLEKKGGVDYAANKADNAAFSSSITQQQKQLGSMGSFVKNMDAQINKVNDLSKKLSTFDTRILNVPLRAARGRIAGSADQAKYDMYLAEIESEIGKLATGSSASVSELSVGAQQKWEKIHDKNLSIKDMLSLLKETREAGKMRMKSVQDQLDETRKQQRSRGKSRPDPLGIL